MRYWFPVCLILLLLLALPALGVLVTDLLGYESESNAWLEEHFSLGHRLRVSLAAGIIFFLLPVFVLILYFLKLKRKPQAVPSTYLWKKSIEDLHVNRLMQWLRQNVLLILQLLVLLSLIYAVVAPRLHGDAKPGKQFILLIDNSASMSATDVAPNRLEWAKAEAVKEIDAAGDEDTGMVIVFSNNAETLLGFTKDRGLLRRAVASIQPTNNRTQIDEVLALAESLANPTTSTENEAVRPQNAEPGKERQYVAAEGIPTDVHLFSDGRFADVPRFALSNLTMHFHQPGTPDTGTADNLAIVAFDAFRDERNPDKLLVVGKVANFRAEQAQVTVALEEMRGNTPRFLRQQTIFIPKRVVERPVEDESGKKTVGKDVPGEWDVRFEVADIDTHADTVLRLRLIDAADALAVDDQAYLVLGIVRKAHVLIVGDPNPALKNYFDSDSTASIAEIQYLSQADLKDKKKYLDPVRSGDFDLVVFDRCGPASEDEMPCGNTWFIGFPPPPWKLDGAADDPNRVERIQYPPIRGWNDQHRLMQDLRGWQDLAIAEAFRIRKLPANSVKLLEGANGLPLLTAISRGPFTDLVMAFPITAEGDLWNTNWILKPTFPVLRRLVYAYGNVRDTTTEENTRPGDQKLLMLGASVRKIDIRSPRGDSLELDRGIRPEFAFGNTSEVGVYEATWPRDQRLRFAVNLFDAEESNIEPRSVVQIGAEKLAAGGNRRQPYELWRWFVIAGLIFVLLEWWVYNRRVHV